MILFLFVIMICIHEYINELLVFVDYCGETWIKQIIIHKHYSGVCGLCLCMSVVDGAIVFNMLYETLFTSSEIQHVLCSMHDYNAVPSCCKSKPHIWHKVSVCCGLKGVKVDLIRHQTTWNSTMIIPEPQAAAAYQIESRYKQWMEKWN